MLLTLLEILLGIATSIFVVLVLLRWWFAVPGWQGVARDYEYLPPAEDDMTQYLLGETQAHPGLTGILVLDDGRDAFSARLNLIREAKRSIDAQYYMWNADLSGQLLFLEILNAAERGVRIRLLLDDNTTAGTDAILAALNAHHNIQVRLFNPFMIRRFRVLNYLVDFRRLNRRMHNKSLILDGAAVVVGGRNIGDAYFSAHEGMQFSDMDVVGVGHVVPDVENSFERYWSCRSSFAADIILPKASPETLEARRQALHDILQGDVAKAYIASLRKSDPLRDFKSGTVAFDWVPAVLVVDDPAKGQGEIKRHKLLLAGLEKTLGDVQSHIDLATAYFVPGKIGAKFLARAALRGKSVRVLTNSLASNDVVPVHAGYARYRKRLLRLGVKLFELRSKVVEPKRRRGGKSKLPHFGASSSSLHAKIFAIDGARVFVGSFNFDPRSLYLNCEMGFLVESPNFAQHVTRRMDEFIATRSYTPFLEPDGRLSWRDGDNTVYKMEPESTATQRVMAWVISWLPVEWLL